MAVTHGVRRALAMDVGMGGCSGEHRGQTATSRKNIGLLTTGPRPGYNLTRAGKESRGYGRAGRGGGNKHQVGCSRRKLGVG